MLQLDPHVINIAAFCVAWVCVYSGFCFLFHRNPSWGLGPQAGLHFTMCILGLPVAAYRFYESLPDLDWMAATTELDARVCEACAAYFIVDFMHLVVFGKLRLLWIIHHGSSFVIMVAPLLGNSMALVSLTGFFIGDISSPVYAAWLLARLAGNTRLRDAIYPYFAVVFVFARLVLLPPFAYVALGRMYTHLSATNFALVAFGSAFFLAGSFAWSWEIISGWGRGAQKQAAVPEPKPEPEPETEAEPERELAPVPAARLACEMKTE